MARKLAHIEEISSITPIKGKDHLKQSVQNICKKIMNRKAEKKSHI